MGYKTELHCHTAPVSTCSHIPPKKLMEMYRAAGYRTVVIANHFSRVTFRSPNFKGSSWQDKLDYFFSAIKEAREASEGLTVLHALEVRLDEHKDTDYLLYGATEQFLQAHPELLSLSFEKFSALVRGEGYLLYQAHPFRNGMLVTSPRLLDGIEVYNLHAAHYSRNDVAMLWAERMGLKKISGSDLHEQDAPIGGGIKTDKPITSEAELMAVLRDGNYRLLADTTPPDDAVSK